MANGKNVKHRQHIKRKWWEETRIPKVPSVMPSTLYVKSNTMGR